MDRLQDRLQTLRKLLLYYLTRKLPSLLTIIATPILLICNVHGRIASYITKWLVYTPFIKFFTKDSLTSFVSTMIFITFILTELSEILLVFYALEEI